MPQTDETFGDRISELPEDLHVRILSFVPTKDVVATMFLSKRWRSIWTMVAKLEYKDADVDLNDDDYDGEGEENKKSVWWFLENSMQLYKAPVIQSLCMELGRQCPTDADVGKWVANAVDHCVVKLIFKLRWYADPARLPNSLYTCKSLVVLSLFHKIFVDVPSQVSFPSLKWLNLWDVVYKDDNCLLRLLSSCPVLEDLFVTRKKDDNVRKFIVKMPSLLSLSYFSYMSVEDTGTCLVIDTPRLTHFRFYYSSEDYYSIENMPCLNKALISVDTYLDDKFLRSLSLVTDLEFLVTEKSLVRCSTINFSRLVNLRIRPFESDWLEPLIVLLGNSPKLKHLLVDYEFTNKLEDLPLPWNQPSSVPRCLSSQLEIFEWNDYTGREEEEQFLIYILANSKCLKTVRISVRHTFNDEDKEEMMEELKTIPRVSTQSQLLFKTKTKEM